MDTDVRLTAIPQSDQTSTDQAETQGRVKASMFHVQTGIRAGRDFTAWYASLTPEQQAEVDRQL
jgi:hypothetical protein